MSVSPPLRIAMWSGPRNLSTAMMYSFAQRSDTEVIDEPLYAAYLNDTGIEHPYREDIIKCGQTDIEQQITELSKGDCQSPVQYQKHITKHLLAEYPKQWLAKVNNVFLLRHPARVICSYHIKDEDPEMSDIGIEDQWHIYQKVVNLGQQPFIVDSADILQDPLGQLTRLCSFLNLDFQESMLSWPVGPKSYDGIWAPHWYESVWRSNGFGKPPGELPKVPTHLNGLLEQAMPYYEQLQQAITN